MKQNLTFFLCLVFFTNINSQIVIQEIYGGSGSSGFTHNNDFVEIVNIGSTVIDISGYTIYYAAQAGTTWALIGGAVPSNSFLAPGGTFVFCGTQGGTTGATCNCGTSNGTNLNGSQGKITLVPFGSSPPSGACPITALVYGSSDNCSNTPVANSPTSSMSTNLSGSVWSLASPTPTTLLPIRLKDFNLKRNTDFNLLSFSTASETNNDYFTIERSGDGQNFDAIGEIDGAGNSTEERQYEYTDENPLPGINYYRIKQTDYDGKYSYSEIRSIVHEGSQRVAISPRQTQGLLQIATGMEDYAIAVYSSAGQEVARYAGLSGYQTVDIAPLQSGIYFVKVVSGGHSETVKVMKY